MSPGSSTVTTAGSVPDTAPATPPKSHTTEEKTAPLTDNSVLPPGQRLPVSTITGSVGVLRSSGRASNASWPQSRMVSPMPTAGKGAAGSSSFHCTVIAAVPAPATTLPASGGKTTHSYSVAGCCGVSMLYIAVELVQALGPVIAAGPTNPMVVSEIPTGSVAQKGATPSKPWTVTVAPVRELSSIVAFGLPLPATTLPSAAAIVQL